MNNLKIIALLLNECKNKKKCKKWEEEIFMHIDPYRSRLE